VKDLLASLHMKEVRAKKSRSLRLRQRPATSAARLGWPARELMWWRGSKMGALLASSARYQLERQFPTNVSCTTPAAKRTLVRSARPRPGYTKRGFKRRLQHRESVDVQENKGVYLFWQHRLSDLSRLSRK